MGYTPYDWNENIQHRVEYVETRLRHGSPVVGYAYDNGILILTVHRARRKVFEVYDHILYSAIGTQAYMEAIRIESINFAHDEGFNRSPDDVTVQRLVARLSPALRRAFVDGFSSPFIFRGLFGELGREPGRDEFTVLNFDGEYDSSNHFAAIAGSAEADRRMKEILGRSEVERLPLRDAVRLGLEAWSAGRAAALHSGPSRSDGEDEGEIDPHKTLTDALNEGAVEVGILERVGKETRFRLLAQDELDRYRDAGVSG